MTTDEHNALNHRIAEAAGWEIDSLSMYGWLSPSGFQMPLPDFLNDPGEAWNAAEKIVKVAFSLNSEPGGVIFAEIDDDAHPLSGKGFYADTPAFALCLMTKAVLDEREAKR